MEYTVDNEIPLCCRCDNATAEVGWCEKYCGASHGWNGYRREDEEEEDYAE